MTMKAEIIDIENRKTVEKINEKRAGSSKLSGNWKRPRPRPRGIKESNYQYQEGVK